MFTTASTQSTSDSNMKLLADDFEPTEKDVVCGWARQNHDHVGNQRFRTLIDSRAHSYSIARTKLQRTKVIADIVNQVRADSPNGGFVKRDNCTGKWYEIGDDKARDKVGHAIRKAAEALVKKHRVGGISTGTATIPSKSKEAKKAMKKKNQAATISHYLQPSKFDFRDKSREINFENKRGDTRSSFASTSGLHHDEEIFAQPTGSNSMIHMMPLLSKFSPRTHTLVQQKQPFSSLQLSADVKPNAELTMGGVMHGSSSTATEGIRELLAGARSNIGLGSFGTSSSVVPVNHFNSLANLYANHLSASKTTAALIEERALALALSGQPLVQPNPNHGASQSAGSRAVGIPDLSSLAGYIS